MKIIDRLIKIDGWILDLPAPLGIFIYLTLFLSVSPLMVIIPFCIWYPIAWFLTLLGF